MVKQKDAMHGVNKVQMYLFYKQKDGNFKRKNVHFSST
jgi:hypothetical protein